MDLVAVRGGQASGLSNRRRFSRNAPLVTVVIPTLNEEKNLPSVLARLPRSLHELIIVDGRSDDDTVATAIRHWPDVVIVQQELAGKGDALAMGFAVATGEIVVALDGDGSTDPAEIPRFVNALVAGADMVKGSRFLEGGGSDDLTRIRRFGARGLTGLVNLLFRTDYTDLCYGYTAFWRDSLAGVATGIGFEVETSMIISAARAGLVVAEVPSFERARVHGASNLRAVRDGLRILGVIVGARMQRQPRLEPAMARA